MRRSIVVAIGTVLVAIVFLASTAHAQEGDGLEGDIGFGLGIAGGVLLGFSVLHGMFMLISQQKPVAAAFKKANFKAFKVWKFHHLFTLPTLGVWIWHASYMMVAGYAGYSGAIPVLAWAGTGILGVLCISGMFFKIARGKWRWVLRVVHLSLLTAAIVTMGLHVILCD